MVIELDTSSQSEDWYVVARVEDLIEQRPITFNLMNEEIVLWKHNGSIQAWRDQCIHRGAKLSEGCVQEGQLICPYHGWEYSSNGICSKIPACPERKPSFKARAITFSAIEYLGWIWVNLSSSNTQPPLFQKWDDKRFRKIHCGPYFFSAWGTRVIENFLDVSHLPYVHDGILGLRNQPQVSPYKVRIEDDSIIADSMLVMQPNPDGRLREASVIYSYRALRPLTATFTKLFDGNEFSIFFTVTPMTAAQCLGWMIIAIDYNTDQSDEDIRNFQDSIINQDKFVVEGQRPQLLPLNLKSEVHVPSDLLSVAYRSWLRKLNFKYGVIY